MFWLVHMTDAAALVLLSGHMADLGFSGVQISHVFATTAVAALVAPWVAGWLADRYCPSQLLLAGCYLLGCPLLAIAWRQTEFVPFWAAMAGVALIRVPARTLSTVVAFHHLEDSSRFGHIRVWGTAGWVFISWCLSLYLGLWEGGEEPGGSHMGDALLVAAVLSAATGAYCLTLPHTPPGNAGAKSLELFSAFRLLRRREFAVLAMLGFVSSLVSPFFYNFSFLFLTDAAETGFAPSTANWVQSLGQVAEVGVLLCLATSLRRVGIKRVLLLGAGAQCLRFAIFAAGEPVWLVVAGMALHGMVFTFFFTGLAIAVDHFSDEENRASAQGLMAFARSGIGALSGNFLAGQAYDYYALPGGGHDWQQFFLIPACVALAGLAAFGLIFHEQRPGSSSRDWRRMARRRSARCPGRE